jgi:hypothetical protein
MRWREEILQRQWPTTFVVIAAERNGGGGLGAVAIVRAGGAARPDPAMAGVGGVEQSADRCSSQTVAADWQTGGPLRDNLIIWKKIQIHSNLN